MSTIIAWAIIGLVAVGLIWSIAGSSRQLRYYWASTALLLALAFASTLAFIWALDTVITG